MYKELFCKKARLCSVLYRLVTDRSNKDGGLVTLATCFCIPSNILPNFNKYNIYLEILVYVLMFFDYVIFSNVCAHAHDFQRLRTCVNILCTDIS